VCGYLGDNVAGRARATVCIDCPSRISICEFQKPAGLTVEILGVSGLTVVGLDNGSTICHRNENEGYLSFRHNMQ